MIRGYFTTSHAASPIVETLKKVVFLLQAGVDTWDLGGLNPNRVKWLARLCENPLI
jgi:hypothetical protein